MARAKIFAFLPYPIISKTTAFISSRGLRLGCPLLDVLGGISSFICSHWLSLKSYLLIIITSLFVFSLLSLFSVIPIL